MHLDSVNNLERDVLSFGNYNCYYVSVWYYFNMIKLNINKCIQEKHLHIQLKLGKYFKMNLLLRGLEDVK